MTAGDDTGANTWLRRYKRKPGHDNAWRCFNDDQPRWPRVGKPELAAMRVVLVRDAVSSLESVLRRFWIFESNGGTVDTLAREEAMFEAAHNRLRANVDRVDCRRRGAARRRRE